MNIVPKIEELNEGNIIKKSPKKKKKINIKKKKNIKL